MTNSHQSKHLTSACHPAPLTAGDRTALAGVRRAQPTEASSSKTSSITTGGATTMSMEEAMRSNCKKSETRVLTGGEDPTPFAPAGAMRPRPYILTEARGTVVFHNDNKAQPSNDNVPRGVREEMDARLRLPRVVLDLFTGKPLLDGKSRPITLGPVSYFALNTAIGVAAALATMVSVSYAPKLALVVAPIAMLVQTSRLRKNQTHFGHEASHGNFFLKNDPRRSRGPLPFIGMTPNALMGALSTTIGLTETMEDYRRKHDLHHALDTFTTVDDPDTRCVRRLHDLKRALLDPRLYVRDFASRIRSNLLAMHRAEDGTTTPDWRRRVMAIVWLTMLMALAVVMPFAAWLLAVLVPYVILYRLSGVLQMLSLHAWDLPASRSFQEYADRTFGRFSGVELPPCGLFGRPWIKAWTAWWLEILLLELPFRLGVLTSDLQAHDVHHLEWILAYDMHTLPEFVDDWRNQPFRRAEVIRDSGDPLKMEDREIWGVRAMWQIARNNLARLNAGR